MMRAQGQEHSRVRASQMQNPSKSTERAQGFRLERSALSPLAKVLPQLVRLAWTSTPGRGRLAHEGIQGCRGAAFIQIADIVANAKLLEDLV
mmetsp:Transcript_67291/g.156220  ORF Transcript_67291/g.156220 Transcript_67291/m.156220 type:complete len:92 (+) Transcript_67291:3-278(+)